MAGFAFCFRGFCAAFRSAAGHSGSHRQLGRVRLEVEALEERWLLANPGVLSLFDQVPAGALPPATGTGFSVRTTYVPYPDSGDTWGSTVRPLEDPAGTPGDPSDPPGVAVFQA